MPFFLSINSEEDYTFHGDKTKEDIVNFALRMSAPAVQQITRADSLANIKNANRLFFMYVGNQEGPLWDAYYDTAVKMQPYAFFYCANADIVGQHIDTEQTPAVFVYKESLHYFYPGEF